MTEFLLELYVPRSNCTGVDATAADFRRAAAELTAEGTAVRLVRTLLVPEDETCFLLVEAASADQVRETAARAVLPFERIVETANGRGGPELIAFTKEER